MKKSITSVHVILDKSGSMESVKDATISAYNEYVSSLKRDAKSNYELSLTLFDTQVETGRAKPLVFVSDLDEGSYRPGGCTALYDAVYMTLQAARSEKGDRKHIAIILTDGYENASQECNASSLKRLVQELEKEGNWTIVYLGANQDAWAESAKWGVRSGNASVYRNTDMGIKTAMQVLAVNTSDFSMSNAGSSAYFFSASDSDKLKYTV